VKNITVSVDDETYRRARIKAAESDTSVSALVRRFLSGLASAESDVERLKREERALRARIAAFTAGNRVCRGRTCTVAVDDLAVSRHQHPSLFHLSLIVFRGYGARP
jgi:hypothetical protein